MCKFHNVVISATVTIEQTRRPFSFNYVVGYPPLTFFIFLSSNTTISNSVQISLTGNLYVRESSANPLIVSFKVNESSYYTL